MVLLVECFLFTPESVGPGGWLGRTGKQLEGGGNQKAKLQDNVLPSSRKCNIVCGLLYVRNQSD